ncbi:MAG: helix-turn-helix transcriptional regulator [Acidimicrobiales bacterium]
MTADTTTTTDRFLTVPELIERWPIGRNSTYAIIKGPDFPRALVPLRRQSDGPRSTVFRETAILAFEASHMVHASEFDLEEDAEPTLPLAMRAQPQKEPLMPGKGFTGTTRRAPLRADRGVKLYAPPPPSHTPASSRWARSNAPARPCRWNSTATLLAPTRVPLLSTA